MSQGKPRGTPPCLFNNLGSPISPQIGGWSGGFLVVKTGGLLIPFTKHRGPNPQIRVARFLKTFNCCRNANQRGSCYCSTIVRNTPPTLQIPTEAPTPGKGWDPLNKTCPLGGGLPINLSKTNPNSKSRSHTRLETLSATCETLRNAFILVDHTRNEHLTNTGQSKIDIPTSEKPHVQSLASCCREV